MRRPRCDASHNYFFRQPINLLQRADLVPHTPIYPRLSYWIGNYLKQLKLRLDTWFQCFHCGTRYAFMTGACALQRSVYSKRKLLGCRKIISSMSTALLIYFLLFCFAACVATKSNKMLLYAAVHSGPTATQSHHEENIAGFCKTSSLGLLRFKRDELHFLCMSMSRFSKYGQRQMQSGGTVNWRGPKCNMLDKLQCTHLHTKFNRNPLNDLIYVATWAKLKAWPPHYVPTYMPNFIRNCTELVQWRLSPASLTVSLPW